MANLAPNGAGTRQQLRRSAHFRAAGDVSGGRRLKVHAAHQTDLSYQ
jgi:hypothetical protein